MAVRDAAFVTSPLPVVISLEMHCSRTQQVRVADILRETLGGQLLLPEEAARRAAKGPLSPLDLAGFVIVKGKAGKAATCVRV